MKCCSRVPIPLTILLIDLISITSLPAVEQVKIRVHTQSPVRTMKGGVGASWHAIGKEGVYKNPDWDYPVRNGNPRGSALQGNPPGSNIRAWQQLYHHASWLGLNWMRVELAQLMYEPGRGRFDWDNDEMQTLYKILEWCQQNKADVFLQQMWAEVEWNAYPGVHPLISTPRSLTDHAEGLATLVDYLIHKKKFSCIRWVCIANEPPGGTWGYWWTTGSYPCVPFTAGLRAARQEFDRRGIKIPISGPDWTDLPPFDAGKIDFDDYVGSYDIHSYQGVSAKSAEILAQWAAWAHAHDKPFFLSEMGNMQLGWGKNNPGPRSFAAALSNAETIVRGIRAGVDAFNRWSFVNRGDLDGQWQLVRTFDIAAKKYYSEVSPEPVAYYGYGIITRFLSKYSSPLTDEVVGSSAGAGTFPTVTLQSPAGNLTTYLLNLGNSTTSVDLEFEGMTKGKEFSIYQVTEEAVSKPEYRMDPLRHIRLDLPEPRLQENLPPRSITVVTSYRLKHSDNGIGFDSP